MAIFEVIRVNSRPTHWLERSRPTCFAEHSGLAVYRLAHHLFKKKIMIERPDTKT
jgi:hypothetical protein